MKNNVESAYLRLYRWAYGKGRVTGILNELDVVSVILTAAIYAFALIFTGFSEWSIMTPLRLLLTTGIPFLIVSILRHVLNMPRPCRVFELDFLPSKKQGESFPSRHVFSAFSIGTALCFVIWPLGVLTLALGVAIAMCRVCLGNHFLRDVIAGALIGVGCSLIGMLVL